ncbi:hypothetical protein IJG89_03050 [Candidatus Saccharibacteria bacterium]|nr:hypothetical protein [Candidatus Saccharibacteria bacterium]
MIKTENSAILLARIQSVVDKMYTALINKGAIDRLTRALDNAITNQNRSRNVTFTRITREMLDEINLIRQLQGKTLLTNRNIIAFASAINDHLIKHIEEYGSAKRVATAAFDVLTNSNTLVLPGNNESKNTLLVKKNTNNFADSVTIGNTKAGETSLKNISPRSERQVRKSIARKQTLKKR